MQNGFIADVIKETYHGHSRKQRKEDSTPSSGDKKFDSTHVVVGSLGVDGTEGDGRRDHNNEHEDGNGNGLGVEVGHFFNPMSADGTLEISNHTSAPRLSRICNNVGGTSFC